MIVVPKSLSHIHDALLSINARAVVVGGYVRDAYMGRSLSKDIDIEVYACHDINKIKDVLSALASVHEVGKNFGVLKMHLDDYDYDISLPRTESKTGDGHKGFTVVCDGLLTFSQAAKRRDFTMNAMGFDLQSKTLLDPYSGLKAIKNRSISIVNEVTFIEDPLRILRAVQFAARFDFTIDEKTLLLCSHMVSENALNELPKERIFQELQKLLLRADKPSVGLRYLKKMGGLFPALQALDSGTIFENTLDALDLMSNFTQALNEDKLILMMSTLCLGFMKQDNNQKEYKYSPETLADLEAFISSLSDDKDLLKKVVNLLLYYAQVNRLFKDKARDGILRKLSTKVNIQQLILVAKADYLACEKENDVYEAGIWLYEKSLSLGILNEAPKALLLGRHLLDYGLLAGPEFKKYLDTAYQAQLDGEFSDLDGALAWFEIFYKNKKKNKA